MKCPNCGCGLNAYKEVKTAMAEFKFDRSYLEEEIKKAIAYSVEKGMRDSASMIETLVESKIKKFSWFTRDIDKAVKEEVEKQVIKSIMPKITQSIDLSFSIIEKKEKEDK